MAIDPRYVAGLDLQQYMVDKDSGLPLAGGKVFLFQDSSRAVPKAAYELSGTAPNYSFSPLPNPIELSAVGTIQDNSGNDTIPYYLPFLIVNGEITTTPDLYYIAVYSSTGVFQFSRQAWPPNSEENAGPPTEDGNLANYIPNGQFIVHTNVNPDNSNELPAGSTALAPGGWTFELPVSTSSLNTAVFTPFSTWTDIPSESPPYAVTITCTSPSPGDTIKSLRIKFTDVNKFANDMNYTFGFWAQANTTITDINVNYVKYFGSGGSSEIIQPVETFTIGNEYTLYSTLINFGDNAGQTIQQPTFIAIDIAFPVNSSFNISFTNFVLVLGNQTLSDYPVQTDADTVARSIYGWTNIPDYTGMDLYLPPVLTPFGMQWDHSVIGKVEASMGAFIGPNSTSPVPIGNDMPCDGSSYVYNEYSTLGIPFARLGNFLLANSPVSYIPMFGTGLNFSTANPYIGSSSIMRLSGNSSGIVTYFATDFNTGFSFTEVSNYGGSNTGGTIPAVKAYSSSIANQFIFTVSSQLTNPTAGTSGFTLAIGATATDLLAFQALYAQIATVSATSLTVGTSSPGKYWTFANATTNYYMWFNVVGEVDPAPGGTGIRIILDPSSTAQDVANICREACNAYQISSMQVTSAPISGSYWTFFTNPASPIHYYVWYSINGAGTDPAPAGLIGIKISLTGSPTAAQIVTATYQAIDKYQYSSPDLRGMFLRGSDPTSIWDVDSIYRFSTVGGIAGNNLGTFEFSQFLSHIHSITPSGITGLAASGDTNSGGSFLGPPSVIGMTASGGSETRSVNTYVNFVIKY